MVRRSLFFGLTLILILAFTFLSVRGCRQEDAPPEQPRETVEKSETTATRVLKPQDLEIGRSQMTVDRSVDASGKPLFAARHEIEIFNRGSVPYMKMRLRIAYLSSTGKILETKHHTIDQTILPGASLGLADIRIDGLSEPAAEARLSIVYADIGSSSQEAKPHN